MSRHRMDLIFVITSLLIVAGWLILAWAIFAENRNALEMFGWVTGAIIPGVAYIWAQAQQRSLRLFLFTNRILSRFTTNAPTWNLSVTMQDERLTEMTLDQIARRLFEFRSKSREVKVERINDRRMNVSIESFPTVEIAFTPALESPISGTGDKELPYVQASIRNYHVGYPQARATIDNEISPVLETISSTLGEVETKYSFVIRFDKEKNPFFGLYIANLPQEAISNFSILLTFDQRHQETVSISKSRVTINTRTQTSLRRLALEFLTFGSELRQRLSSV